jgi:hypothetical protein
MKYELLNTTEDGIKIYARIDDDGLCRVTCTEENPDYLAWLEGQKPAKTPKVVDETAEQASA